MLRALAVAATLAIVACGGAAGAPATQASSAGIDAANQLIALPWVGIVQQRVTDTTRSLAKLDGKKLINVSASGWSFRVTAEDMTASIDAAAPPGFAYASLSGFGVRAPLNGSWSFRVAGKLHARAVVPNVVSASGDLPFSLTISGVQISADAQLDASDPTRPRLTSGTVHLKATIGGNGLFGGAPIGVTVTRNPDGTFSVPVPITNLSLGFFQHIGVHLNAKLVLTIYPFPDTQHVRDPLSIVDLSATFLPATLALQGSMSVRFPDPVGNQDVAAGSVSFPLELPSTDQIDQALELLGGTIPIPWPPPGSPAGPAPPPPPASVDWAGVRNALEAGIDPRHMPYGAVLSVDYGRTGPPRGGRSFTYGLDADSAIWTGHYLAAESFRYAATHDAQALAHVQDAITGLQRDFDVTNDAVLENGVYTAVPTTDDGIFARSTMPSNDGHGWTDSWQKRERNGTCLYVKPTAGWSVGKARFGTLREATAKLGVLAARLAKPLEDPKHPILFGTGCGNHPDADNPLSRDAYSGVFFGLATAYTLVPPVQGDAQKLVDRALDYLLTNKWNVPLPPDGTITTTFMGDIDAQLDLLRVGATVDPKRWNDTYRHYAAASELDWISIWFSIVDPLLNVYKFNLGHAYAIPPLLFETDPSLRANYLTGYRMLRKPTERWRSAYFDLADVLVGVTPASPAVASTVTSELADWVTRWNLVKDPTTQMPTNTTSKDAAAFLAAQWPNNVKPYTNTKGGHSWQMTFPVPLQDRTGDGMDFVWQRPAFTTGVDAPGSTRTAGGYGCAQTPPSAAQIEACSSAKSREGSGVDYLLPYWLGLYLHVLPG